MRSQNTFFKPDFLSQATTSPSKSNPSSTALPSPPPLRPLPPVQIFHHRSNRPSRHHKSTISEHNRSPVPLDLGDDSLRSTLYRYGGDGGGSLEVVTCGGEGAHCCSIGCGDLEILGIFYFFFLNVEMIWCRGFRLKSVHLRNPTIVYRTRPSLDPSLGE